MQTVITHPDGVQEGSRMAQAQEQMAGARIEEIVAPSSTLTESERLSIYSRGYQARLLECFRAQFPCLLEACGEELFAHFVADFLSRHPPSSPSLHQLAEGFPAHLAATRPDADRAPEERESWPDFLIDLAVLERAFHEIFDGPGVEGLQLPDPQEIRLRPLDVLKKARFQKAPCLRVFSFRYPVHRYFSAVRGGDSPSLPSPGRTYLAMHRRDFTVEIVPLLSSEFEALRRLVDGATVEEAVQGELTLEEAQVCLAKWAERSFFLHDSPDEASFSG